jgi:SAM-dependent methyltransferase
MATEPESIDAERLRSEAEFQNLRVESHAPEARDKFYYLVSEAFADYESATDALVGKQVLVVGCSDGGVQPLARKGAFATGIDISDRGVARLEEAIRAEGLSEHARAVVMNAEDLEFPADSFDAIVCTGVLHHLDVEAACRSWRTVLKPGGQVLMVEPLAYHPVVALYRRFTPSMRTPDEHPLGPKDFRVLRRYFDRVEMDAYACTTVLTIPFAYLANAPNLPIVGPLRDGLLAVLTKLDRMLFKVLPFTKYLAWSTFIRCYEPSKTN